MFRSRANCSVSIYDNLLTTNQFYKWQGPEILWDILRKKNDLQNLFCVIFYVFYWRNIFIWQMILVRKYMICHMSRDEHD